jgi:Fibronectin type III domain
MRFPNPSRLTDVGFGVVVLVALAAAGCGQSTPTSPTPLGSTAARGVSDIADVASLASVSTTMRGAEASIVAWECFAGGSPGSCPAPRVSAQGVTAGEIVTAAPTNLTQRVGGSTVQLSWGVPAGSQPTSYVIEAGSAPGLSNITTFNTGNAATGLTVNNVPPGAYFVRVRGRDAAGSGPASNEVTVTVVTGTAPSPAQCQPRNLTAIAVGSEVSLSWDEPPGAGSQCGSSTYLVQVGSAPGASNIAQVSTPGLIGNYAVSGAPPGTYYIRVRSQGTGGLSAPSNEVILTVTGIAPPGTTTWTGLVANGDGVTVGDDDCGTLGIDITATIVQSGTSVTGLLRSTVRIAPRCAGLVGFAFSQPFVGTVTGQLSNGSGTFSATTTGGGGDSTTISGNYANGRMTGTAISVEDGVTSTSTFAMNRQ